MPVLYVRVLFGGGRVDLTLTWISRFESLLGLAVRGSCYIADYRTVCLVLYIYITYNSTHRAQDTSHTTVGVFCIPAQLDLLFSELTLQSLFVASSDDAVEE